jgi:hypothetical protein
LTGNGVRMRDLQLFKLYINQVSITYYIENCIKNCIKNCIIHVYIITWKEKSQGFDILLFFEALDVISNHFGRGIGVIRLN